jgi:hypothetical protein
MPHGFHRSLVCQMTVAATHRAGRFDGRSLHGAHEIK